MYGNTHLLQTNSVFYSKTAIASCHVVEFTVLISFYQKIISVPDKEISLPPVTLRNVPKLSSCGER